MDPFLCLDASPNILGMLDTNIAPTLLYYSYIPILFLSLFFSIFLYTKSHILQTRALLSISIIFSLWILNEVLQWVAVDAWLVHFGWQMSALLQVGLVMAVVYFVYVFLRDKIPSFFHLVIGFCSILPVLLFLPTHYNVTSFDIVECQSSFGTSFWSYVYIIQIVFAVFSMFRQIQKGNQFPGKENCSIPRSCDLNPSWSIPYDKYGRRCNFNL